jgi:topoisomerase-4 subunit B
LVTSHDWREPVDVDHIASIRADVPRHARGGVLHLVLEVLAYALDEAAEGATRTIDVVVPGDGSVVVRDDGRGTDTRRDDDGTWIVKPVMATRDLRFFGVPDAPVLADGLPRWGMSVVAALSERLVHTNVRVEGAWTATYRCGVPDGRPSPVVATGLRPGTTVGFVPDSDVFGSQEVDLDALRHVLASIESSATLTLTTP